MELAFALFVILFMAGVYFAPAVVTSVLLTRRWAQPWFARTAGIMFGVPAAFGAFKFYYAHIAPLWKIETMDQEIYGRTTVYHDPYHPWGAWVLAIVAGAVVAGLVVQVCWWMYRIGRWFNRTESSGARR
jgi:glycerol uptake facilitator-like aquaporin